MLKDTIIRLQAPVRRIGLENRDFSILANNCWGGIVSRDRRLPYNSPTCGTYFFSKDYLRFLSDPHRYLAMELEEVPFAESVHAAEVFEKEGREPVIGRMGDVEVVLLHYPSFAEARAKWDRRKARIRWDNLLVKYSDQNGFRPEDFEVFRALPYRNKLFLTVNPAYAGPFTRVIPDEWGEGYAVDDIKSSFRVMNVNEVLNGLRRE
jgi:uncharacterized protein (DUF1919 family)